MSTSWNAILHNAARAIGDAAGVPVEPSEIVLSPNPKLGDISFGCFRVAKLKGQNPAELAKELVTKLGTGDHSIESVAAAGPYLNLTLRSGDFINRIIKDVETKKADYGRGEPRKKQLMLEYVAFNTHKEVHVGHLRNATFGSALARLLLNDGWKVTTSSFHGDVGAHVAKCLWLLVRKNATNVKQITPKRKKKDPPFVPLSDEKWTEYILQNLSKDFVDVILKTIPKDQRNGKYLGLIYSESTKVLEENPDWKTEVSEVQRKLEGKDKAWEKLWRETRRWSVAEMDGIFQDLGLSIDRRYYESEVVEEGQRTVDALLKAGVARESQGAIIVDLEDQKLGAFLIRKSDGTSLYATKDLALAKLKFSEFPKVERSLIVVDNRQTLYFKQLFATLKLMGFQQKMEFVGYEFLTLKTGAMSSREGNIVTWQDFREEVLGFAHRETEKRHPDWNEGRITHTAWCLMMGGIKFSMLKQDSDKIITFDMEQALAFDGDTGPYVQYAATRLNSILKKGDWKAEKGMAAGDPSTLSDPSEKRLALCMAQFPHAAEKSAAELRPTVLAQWCLEMAAKTNEFYRDVKVLDGQFGAQQARLRLVASARTVLMLALNLLGIPVPEEM